MEIILPLSTKLYKIMNPRTQSNLRKRPPKMWSLTIHFREVVAYEKKRPCFTESESVTAFWVSPRFKYPRNQNVQVFGIPSGDTQNTNSKLNKRLR